MSREFEVGQKVRFTTDVHPFKKGEEGTVVAVAASFLRVTHPTDDPGWPIRPSEVEPAEPPVETFGPGDVVRHKKHRSFRYTLGRGGYFSHQLLEWVSSATQFTSEDYELVVLVEPPL